MDLVTPLVSVLIAFLAFVLVGLACDLLSSLLMRVLSVVCGEAIYLLWSTLFLPGVLMHELSHALFLFVTGAEIDEIVVREDTRHPLVLFRRRGYQGGATSSGHTAGHVACVWRGPVPVESLQRVFGSIAPTVVGVVAMVALYRVIAGSCEAWWQYMIACYLFVCALLGSSMSVADLENMAPGLPVCLLLLYVIFLAFGVDLQTFVPEPIMSWIRSLQGPVFRRR
jgi:hypothetical protein